MIEQFLKSGKYRGITHPAETESVSIHVLLTNPVPQALFARLSITTQCAPVQMGTLGRLTQDVHHVSHTEIM